MAVFSVFEPPRERPDRAERFAFVRDGFSWGAFIFGPLWMLARKLWLVFVIYLVIVVGLAFAMHALAVPEEAQIAVAVLVALLLGLEGGTLRRWTLRRRRWRDLGIVVADDLEAAERRFFDAWVAEGGVPPTWSAPPASQMAAGPASQSYTTTGPDVIGLFPRTGSKAVTVAIVDYGSGNLHSAAKAFERAARESGHDQPIVVTGDPEAVRRADRVVLPGVGAFADCRRGLDAVPGMVEALDDTVRGKGRPFLGICVGMQLMAERGREYEVTPGLGWIPGEVDRITPKDPDLKIPHMGWNTLNALVAHPLLAGIPVGPDGLHAYFVHSYHLNVADRHDLVAEADYGGAVTAMVARDTYAGTQFHPEKSQRLGLALIANFLQWKP